MEIRVVVYGCVLKDINGNVGVSLSPYKKSRAALIGHIVMIWECGRVFMYILEFREAQNLKRMEVWVCH